MPTLHLESVWSRQVQAPASLALPRGLRLASHQLRVYEALSDPDVDVVFDTAMTGDGKTLAACLPALVPPGGRKTRALLAYPTNELIRDQLAQFARYKDLFGQAPEAMLLDSARLSEYGEAERTTRFESILHLIKNTDVLLTNPDIFHLIERFAYVDAHQNPATLAEQLNLRFRYLVFDEFHVFGAAQVTAVLDAMLFIRAQLGEEHPPRCLFLSATPGRLLTDALARCGLRVRVIEGEYQHGEGPFPEHRQILQPATLEVVRADRGGMLAYAAGQVDAIRAFFADHPGSKGLIICNSVFAAKRLCALLRERLGDALRVGENTGLTSRAERAGTGHHDLIVATSTVDVGVDFHINYLLFESLDGGTFIQRLGRLGRHPGFPRYHAVALVPGHIAERIEERWPAGATVDRCGFLAGLREEVFPTHQGFGGYLTRWGSIIAAQRIADMRGGAARDHYTDLLKAYCRKAYPLFQVQREGGAARRREIQAMPAVAEELRAFRGASRLDVWLCEPASRTVATSSILRLLSGADFDLLDRRDAVRLADAAGERLRDPALGLYARILGFLDEPRRVQLRFAGTLVRADRPAGVARERSGFTIEAAHPESGRINDVLRRQPLCVCVAPPALDVHALRRCYRLPPFFELHPVVDRGGATCAVAFGQDALLLDSLLHWRGAEG
jgi:CRISPR-associated endonuclease/helicase Cas3